MTDELLTIETFVERTFGENAFVVSTEDDSGGRVGWVIEPSFPPQVTHLLAYVADEKITIARIVLTHGHADHIAGLDHVHDAHPEAEVAMAAADQPMLADANRNLSAPFGLAMTVRTRADTDLVAGMPLSLGRLTWQVLDTSGHSPGGISLHCPEAGAVFTGDALFAGSIGRADFSDSDGGRLIANIRENLLTLGDETIVYSGHGPITTIGNERKSNPFLSE